MSEFFSQEYIYIIVSTGILSLALAAVAVSYVFLLIKLGKSEKDKLFLQSKIRDQTSDILQDAHEKRLRIIKEAMDKAHSLLKDTQGFSIDVQNRFTADLEEIKKKQEELVVIRAGQISKLYEQFTLNLQRKTEEQFVTTARTMEKHAVSEIEDLRKEIEDERLFIKKQLTGKIEEEYVKAKKSIEDYKAEQVKKLDKQVFDVLNALTREIIGRSLSIQDHNDLVQKALVEMKTQMSSE